MKNNKGISLIVLIITIMVMSILASAVIVTLSNTGIIGKANDAVNASDLGEVQQLAHLIWTNATLDNVKYINETYIKDKLKENKIDADKYIITVTEDGVSVALKKWETIYEGNASTQNGVVTLKNEHLFDLLNEFRITIEGPEYTGSLHTKRLIYYNGMYFFAAAANDEAIYFSALEDAIDGISKLPSDVVLIAANHAQDANGDDTSGIIILNSSMNPVADTYKITKIERRNSGLKPIFAGDTEAGVDIAIDNVDITHRYVLMKDGVEYISGSRGASYVFAALDLNEFIGSLTLNSSGTPVLMTLESHSDLELYDIGVNPKIVRDGEYYATSVYNGIWSVSYWPKNSKGIPETVAGHKIDAVISAKNSEIYYDRPVDIIFEDSLTTGFDFLNVKVAKNVNLDKFLYSIASHRFESAVIDFTELDEITIPEDLLYLESDSYFKERISIYVTEEVKANYQEYSIVKVK